MRLLDYLNIAIKIKAIPILLSPRACRRNDKLSHIKLTLAKKRAGMDTEKHERMLYT